MPTDCQRVEAALFPAWLANVLECGVNPDDRDGDYHRCQRILQTAIDEALAGCDERRRGQIMRRVARVHNTITEDYRRAGVHVDKIGLTCLYALQTVLEADYLELVEGSPLSEAVQAIVAALSDAFSEARLDASARKHAAKILTRLQVDGYFVGINREAA